MQKKIGIWVDRKKALIVILDPMEAEPSIQEILSDRERHVRLSGGSRTKRTPWGPQQIASDSKLEARDQQHMKRFYQQVIEAVSDAYKIILMGPGEAKMELKKEIDKSKSLSECLVHMETCDKMTDRQFAARVREFFATVP